MQSMTVRPIDSTYTGVLDQMRAVVSLAGHDDASSVPADVFDALDLDREDVRYTMDTAQEAADSMVYAIERLGVIESDGSAGELRSVELLLGGGGPTITLTATLRDGDVRDFTLWHSWGEDVGKEASVTARNQADVETVAGFLSVLGAVEL